MKIFISYAHVDESQVRELVEILREAGHSPWFDYRLVPGRPWDQQLLDAIRACERFLYALTPESVQSEWCQWEFAQAVHHKKPVVPVLIQAKTPLPGILGRIQYADFSQGPTPRLTAKFLRGIQEAQTISPEDVPLLPSPSKKPERPIEDKKSRKPLADRLYNDAYQQYRDKRYTEAQDLLHDCLSVNEHHTEAQDLLVLVKRQLEGQEKTPPPRTEIEKPTSREQTLPFLVDEVSEPFYFEPLTETSQELRRKEMPKIEDWLEVKRQEIDLPSLEVYSEMYEQVTTRKVADIDFNYAEWFRQCNRDYALFVAELLSAIKEQHALIGRNNDLKARLKIKDLEEMITRWPDALHDQDEKLYQNNIRCFELLMGLTMNLDIQPRGQKIAFIRLRKTLLDSNLPLQVKTDLIEAIKVAVRFRWGSGGEAIFEEWEDALPKPFMFDF